MKLGCVLTACDLNPLYAGFIPVFIRQWERLYPGVDVKVVLVANEVPSELREHSERLVLFRPLKGVSTSFTAQCVRIFYAGVVDCDGAVLVTDVDSLPMSDTYYADAIAEFPESKFVSLRAHVYPPDAPILPMTFSAAHPAVWADVFSCHSLEDVRNHLLRLWSEAYTGHWGFPYFTFRRLAGALRRALVIRSVADYRDVRQKLGAALYFRWRHYEWYTDERELSRCAKGWHRRTGNLVLLPADYLPAWRLDRDEFTGDDGVPPELVAKFKEGSCFDYHSHRPYSRYKELVDSVVAMAERSGA